MLRVIFGAIAFALLAGCETEEQQRERIEQALPSGCRLVDLGKYRSIDNLVMIQCPDGYTMNGVKRYWTGKVSIERAFASFTPSP